MKISIAMCTYNGARYLREQLDSIAAQTRLPDELVICDDRSTDNTEEIVRQFITKVRFPVRLHINDRNLGSFKNFEKAIGLCEGDIIALSDQDDVWLPGKLQQLMTVFSSRPNAGLVFTNLEMVDADLRPLGFSAWESRWVQFGRREQHLFKTKRALNILLKANVVTGCSMAFRAELRELILPLDRIIQDHWIALLAGATCEIAFVDCATVKYRQHQYQQIGLVPPPLEGGISAITAPRTSRLEFEEQHLNLEALHKRLASCPKAFKYKYLIRKLGARRSHLHMRGSLLRQRFFSRVLLVLKDLLRLRYHRFSEGWRDAFNDVKPSKLIRL